MPKRFTEINKWTDKWFRSLEPRKKLLWLYLLDNCNHGGFFEIDYDRMGFELRLNEEQKEVLSSDIEGLNKGLIIRGEYLWIKNFLRHQNNLPLNPLNNAHKQIILQISEHPDFTESMSLIQDIETSYCKVKINQKEAIWIRDNGICQYCKETIKDLTKYELDHIFPKSKGCYEYYSNMACSCMECNRKKSDNIVDLIVQDYSAREARQELINDSLTLNKFNKFFKRNIEIYNGTIRELGANRSPIGISKGRGIGKVIINKEQIEDIYKAYPKHEGSKLAKDSIKKALNKISFEELLPIVELYASKISWQDKQFIPLPATWFNQERWLDDPSAWENISSIPNKLEQDFEATDSTLLEDGKAINEKNLKEGNF